MLPGKERLLFPRQYSLEPWLRKPIRPLGEVSDFVVEIMPDYVSAIQKSKEQNGDFLTVVNKLSSIAESKLSDLIIKFSPTHSLTNSLGTFGNINLVILDLMMLQSAITNSPKLQAGGSGQIQPPEILIDLIGGLSKAVGRKIMTMTYADVIFTNPLLDDPRTFFPLSTAEGRSELDFYDTHKRVEISLRRLHHATIKATDLLMEKGWAKVREASLILRASGILTREEFQDRLKKERQSGMDKSSIVSRTEVDVILNGMNRVGSFMNPEKFVAFRTYFDPYPDLPIDHPMHLDGASGKFSAAFPAWELLLAGDTLPSSRHKYTSENYPYFSREEQTMIDKVYERVKEGKTLDNVSVSIGDPEEIYGLLLGANDLLKEFRLRHYVGVAKQIPGVLSGVIASTGREKNVGQFLRERRDYDLIRRPREKIAINYSKNH